MAQNDEAAQESDAEDTKRQTDSADAAAPASSNNAELLPSIDEDKVNTSGDGEDKDLLKPSKPAGREPPDQPLTSHFDPYFNTENRPVPSESADTGAASKPHTPDERGETVKGERAAGVGLTSLVACRLVWRLSSAI